MAFSAIQSGTLAGVTSINVQGGNVHNVPYIANTTPSGAADSGVAAEFTTGRKYYRITGGHGHYNTSGAYPLPIGATLSNGLVAKHRSITLRKHQHLTDATNNGTAQQAAEFKGGVITYSGSCIAFLETTETPLETGTVTLSNFTIPLSTSASIAGNAVISGARYAPQFDEGGALAIIYSFSLTGAITLTGTHPFSATSWTATLTVDNSQSWSGTLMAEDVTAFINYRTGTPTRFQFAGPFHGAVTIT